MSDSAFKRVLIINFEKSTTGPIMLTVGLEEGDTVRGCFEKLKIDYGFRDQDVIDIVEMHSASPIEVEHFNADPFDSSSLN